MRSSVRHVSMATSLLLLGRRVCDAELDVTDEDCRSLLTTVFLLAGNWSHTSVSHFPCGAVLACWARMT